MIKVFEFLFLFFLVLSSNAQSNLTSCRGLEASWDRCKGVFKQHGQWFSGEFRNGQLYGAYYPDKDKDGQELLKRNIAVLTATNLPWIDKVSKLVSSELSLWLNNNPIIDFNEIPYPTFPTALSLVQDKWESNKEFEDRVALSRANRQKVISVFKRSTKQRLIGETLKFKKLPYCVLKKRSNYLLVRRS